MKTRSRIRHKFHVYFISFMLGGMSGSRLLVLYSMREGAHARNFSRVLTNYIQFTPRRLDWRSSRTMLRT